MDLLVASEKDPAGINMARHLKKDLSNEEEIFKGKYYDLVIISSPVIEADWIDDKYDYDGFVFLSKHYASSGRLALTCHSTGNFSYAQFGGKDKEIAVPYPSLQKQYMKNLWDKRKTFPDFEITLEATHHGPTSLKKPSLFIEVGTTEKQWNDKHLCGQVASIVDETVRSHQDTDHSAICFGGTHYPKKFTEEVINGNYSIGTIMPKYALEYLDESVFNEIIKKNNSAKYALLDWNGLGKNKHKLVNLLESSNLEIIRL